MKTQKEGETSDVLFSQTGQVSDWDRGEGHERFTSETGRPIMGCGGWNGGQLLKRSRYEGLIDRDWLSMMLFTCSRGIALLKALLHMTDPMMIQSESVVSVVKRIKSSQMFSSL